MKWVRSAFWVGRAKDGEEAHLRRAVDTDLVPRLRTFPGVHTVKALWPRSREDSPPDIFCQVIVEFDDRNGLDRMLASNERKATRPLVHDLASRFDGTISHIDFEVG
ncbi:hypothetical protein HZF05_05345 [Sphingomonas sp. CGMCC 1.13654]|uniref:Uncharacterized protein n=1 Tax=Sphingomonas chungangi TaxID=2683589 RepID=A0A838L372_9SPHN|nr:hypothetical protein [Sphingomonas chungangi]MBA2933517.1 hypothetical protein [Sphingomonas chungangi]MVW54850.1 hypothetical protein [Sphingomonas chungangi]